MRWLPAAVLSLGLSVAMSADLPSADPQQRLAALDAALASGLLESVAVYHLGYDVATRVAVTPEMLETDGHLKFRGVLPPAVLVDLKSAIQQARVKRSDGRADLRWAAVFYNGAGERLHAVQLDGRFLFVGSGRHGVIDGAPASLNGALARWFERNFYEADWWDVVIAWTAPR
jgi:hypothetical protein